VDSLNKSIEIFDKDISKINEINEIYLRVESEQKRLSDKMGTRVSEAFLPKSSICFSRLV
jgi:hypothetical protein